MTPRASISRLVLISAASLGLASACGGNSFTNGGEGGESGSGSGSTSGAGAKNTAGSNSAGKGSGGSTGSGGASSGGGSSGGGNGSRNPACDAPAEPGNCLAHSERWFHDAAIGLCRPFVYGGCGGNANNYDSFEACQNACPGGAPNYDSCKEPTDCVVGSTGCCGICDGPDVRARDLTAYNKAHQADVSTCGGADIACAPCPPLAPNEGSLKYFVADCVQGQCAVVDLRTSELTACETAQDCRLRNGTQCCESCAPGYDVVAVRTDGSFEKLVCGSEPTACAACLPAPPLDAAATCVEGHCIVDYLVAGAQ